MFGSITESFVDSNVGDEITVKPGDSLSVPCNSDYCCRIYVHLNQEDQNLSFCSWSLFRTVCLLMGGAEGETKKQLLSVIRVRDDEIHKDNGRLNQKVTRGQQSGNNEKFVSVNGIFLHLDEPQKQFRTTFHGLSRDKYGMRLECTKNPTESMKNYVDFVTKNRTTSILNEKLPSKSSMLILNSTHFFGKLKDSPCDTEKVDFHISDTETVPVIMNYRILCREQSATHQIRGLVFRSLTLPFGGAAFSLLLLNFDDREDFDSFETRYFGSYEGKKKRKKAHTLHQFMSQVLKEQKPTKISRIGLPQCTVRSFCPSIRLVQALKDLGMKNVFDGHKAEFLKVFSSVKKKKLKKNQVAIENCESNLHVSHWNHECVFSSLEVSLKDEDRKRKNIGKNKKFGEEIVFNKPFFCFVLHKKTNLIFMMTKVVRPTSSSHGKEKDK